MTAAGADSDDSGSRLAFDIISSFILALTALAGACAPLYLAGYRVLFGGVQARPYTSVPHHEAGVENGDEFRDRKDGILSSSQRSHDHGVEKRSLAFVIGNMFSAGVMVSAGLCHLLGEAIRDMSLHLSAIGGDGDGDTGSSHAFPWATFLCGCGLLITLCADKAASIMSSGGPERHGSGHGHQDIELTMGRSVGHDSNATVIEARPVTEMNGHHHHHLPPQAKVSFITAMLMGVALSFHSLLEGAALGAQETIANSMHIFIAIVSHKGLAAYALGSSLIESKVEMDRFWKVIIPFSVASPIGILFGYLISDMAQGLGAAALSALASGTFLYVAFMEVIPRELGEQDYNIFLKLACLLLGFLLMSLLAVWA